jgi:hypothetical protein
MILMTPLATPHFVAIDPTDGETGDALTTLMLRLFPDPLMRVPSCALARPEVLAWWTHLAGVTAGVCIVTRRDDGGLDLVALGIEAPFRRLGLASANLKRCQSLAGSAVVRVPAEASYALRRVAEWVGFRPEANPAASSCEPSGYGRPPTRWLVS